MLARPTACPPPDSGATRKIRWLHSDTSIEPSFKCDCGYNMVVASAAVVTRDFPDNVVIAHVNGRTIGSVWPHLIGPLIGIGGHIPPLLGHLAHPHDG